MKAADLNKPAMIKLSELRKLVRWYVRVRWIVLASVALPNLIVQFLLQSHNIPLARNFSVAFGAVLYNLVFEYACRHVKKRWALHVFAMLQMSLDVLLIFYLIYSNGGIESHTVMLLFIPILIAGIIWSQKAMFIATIAITLAYSALVTTLLFGGIQGSVSTEGYSTNDPTGFFETLLFINSAFFIVALISSLLARLRIAQNTSLNKAEHEALRVLREQEKADIDNKIRTQALFDSIGEGLIVVNEYGNIIETNSEALATLGYKQEEIIGKWFPKAIPSYDLKEKKIDSTERAIVKALETGRPVSDRVYYVRKNGEKLPVTMTAAPFMVDDRPVGGVVIFRDFTKELEVDRAKSEFISIVSHQLRTPLTSIRLFTDLVKEEQTGPLNAKQREYLDKIEVSTLRMVKLVGDILNVSRIEMGRLKVSPELHQLEEIIQEKLDEISPQLKAKKIKLTYKRPDKLTAKVKVDPNLIGQIIHNLLTNAVRYTREKNGTIDVVFEHSKKGYEFLVTDNGIGIPDSAKSKIFTRFYRADNAISVEGEGTGLGLYLIKMILETAGGKISFVSREGKGTTFHVIIPTSGMRAKEGDRTLS